MRRPTGVWLLPRLPHHGPAEIIDVRELSDDGWQAFGADLLWLTPAVVEEATRSGLVIWSYWWCGPGDDGRAAAMAATDIALTIGQPQQSTIHFFAAPEVEDPDPEWSPRAEKVCEARGFRFKEAGDWWPIFGEAVAAPAGLWDGDGLVGRERIRQLVRV